jgi:Phage phiEco32-like COOH.NH2 ligase-type 2
MSAEVGIDLSTKFLKDVINGWLLGADPEWAVMTPPDVVVPNSGANAVNTTKPAGQIGSDHNGRVWELRPAASPSSYVVATNLWKLLQQSELNKLEKFKWKSGALGAKKHSPSPLVGNATFPLSLADWVVHYQQPFYGMTLAQAQNQAQASWQAQQQQMAQQQQQQANDLDTLGGHVHFGISGFNGQQRQALDAITTGLLNLDILPQKENAHRLSLTQNSHPKYGHFNGGDAVRDCDGHVEYRCPPSWLDRPGQALAVLTSYKLGAARPSAVKWPGDYSLKAGFVDWLDELSSVDVDAWILSQFLATRNFSEIQADPSSDFKPRWRRDNPWER